MELSFEFWYLFPVSIVIATIAMSSGVGGAVFFSPLFMLALKLDPKIAIGSALATEFFGFASGLVAYYKAKLIDFKLAKGAAYLFYPGSYYRHNLRWTDTTCGTKINICRWPAFYWLSTFHCLA